MTDFKMIRVAIEDWGLYNQGILACKWWNADEDLQEIIDYFTELRRKHGVFPHDDLELFNADWEGTSLINENTGFLRIKEIQETLEDLEAADQKKIDYLMDWNGCTFQEALEQYEDVELYEDMTMQDLATLFIEDGFLGDIPESVSHYIDYDAYAYDLSMDYTEVGNDIFRVA